MIAFRLFFLYLVWFNSSELLANKSVDYFALLKKVDDLYRSQSSIAKIEMNIVTPDWSRTLVMDVWSQGKEKTFIRILSPQKERGVSSLKLATKMWNYFPKIDKVIKVPASMLMGSWMGSDLTNDDMIKSYRYSDDFSYSGTLDSGDVVITLTPKETTVSVWGKIVLFLDAKTYLPLKQDFYNEKSKKVRSMLYLEPKIIGSKNIPQVIEIIPLNKKGHKTIVRYKVLQLNVDVPDGTFKRQNLQKRI